MFPVAFADECLRDAAIMSETDVQVDVALLVLHNNSLESCDKSSPLWFVGFIYSVRRKWDGC